MRIQRTLLHMRRRRADVTVMAGRHLETATSIRNFNLLIDAYLPDEQSCQISSRSDLKRRSLIDSMKRAAPPTKTATTSTRWVLSSDIGSVPGPKNFINSLWKHQCEQKKIPQNARWIEIYPRYRIFCHWYSQLNVAWVRAPVSKSHRGERHKTGNNFLARLDLAIIGNPGLAIDGGGKIRSGKW